MTRDIVWISFPPLWQISAGNLSNKTDKIYAGSWLQAYVGWMLKGDYFRRQEQISPENIYNEVLHELFALVDPVLCSKLITLQYSPYPRRGQEHEMTSRIRNIVENKPFFSILPRQPSDSSYVVDDENDEDNYWENTKREHKYSREEVLEIHKITNVFPILKNYEEVDKMIKLTKKIPCEQDNLLNLRKEELLDILQKIKKSLAA